MEKISTIKFHGHVLDVFGTKEEPLFLAVEVARMIDYSAGKTHQMIDSVPHYWKCLVRYKPSNQRGGNQKPVWFLTEAGLYHVLMHSYKPIAQRFQEFIVAVLYDMRIGKNLNIEEFFDYAGNYTSDFLCRLDIINHWRRDANYGELSEEDAIEYLQEGIPFRDLWMDCYEPYFDPRG